MKGITFDTQRFVQPTTDAPHELAEAVNMIEKAGVFTKMYGYTYWLKKVSECRFDHPVDEITKLLEKMRGLADWMLREKREYLSRGAWLTNRLRELRRNPQKTSMPTLEGPSPAP